MQPFLLWVIIACIGLVLYILPVFVADKRTSEGFTDASAPAPSADFPPEILNLMKQIAATPDIEKAPAASNEAVMPITSGEVKEMQDVLKTVKDRAIAASPAEQQGIIARTTSTPVDKLNTVTPSPSAPTCVIPSEPKPIPQKQCGNTRPKKCGCKKQCNRDCRKNPAAAAGAGAGAGAGVPTATVGAFPVHNQIPPVVAGTQTKCQKCPEMPDMSLYIRKDQIPCWACKL
jgi:hypothetical protein